MKISQETYDETLLENEEVFDLSPDDAIKETISQFNQQGITDLDSCVITSHPSTKEGREERLVRSNFTSLLNKLDSFIRSDGTIESDNDSSSSSSSLSSSSCAVILETIESVHEYLRNGTNRNGNNSEETKNVGNDPIPFLTLAHSSSSLFTFMNLLSIIDYSTNDNKKQEDERKVYLSRPSKNQTLILHASLKLLITVLCPRNKKEKDIKIMFKDGFVCFSRMVGLILYHTNLIQQILQHQQDGQIEDEASSLLNTYIETIRLTIKCTMYACKNCEKNKVSFVRCLRATRITDSLGSLIDDFHQLELLSSTPSGDEGCDNTRIITNKERESTIGIISNLVRFALALYRVQDQINSTNNEKKNLIHKDSLFQLMTETCQLISVLCRFDDFRTHATMDSSNGCASSSHDHVLELNREGIIPPLHELMLVSLNQKSGMEKSSGDGDTNQGDVGGGYEINSVALAAAAMSATRVLAVNDEIVQVLVAVGVLKTIKVVLEMGVVDEVDEENEALTKNEAKLEDDEDITVSGEDNEDNEEEAVIENADEEENEDFSKQESNAKMMRSQKEQLTMGAIGLIRNLCGNDTIKTTLCLGSSTSGPSDDATVIVPSVLSSIICGMHMYKNNASIQEHGCGALAAMALRKPHNALRIIHEDGAATILNAMKLFPRNVLVQRQGALAVRNIVSRLVANSSAIEENIQQKAPVDETGNSSNGGEDSNNVRDIFLDLGAEVILRGITGRHQGSVDEAYAALRDLGCAVSMLKYDAKTQSTTNRTVMFGDVKPKFRPVYEES